MSKHLHDIDTYKEGWQRVEFCTVCGAEGLDLSEDCSQSQLGNDQLELFSDSYSKKVDKAEERS
jgi:hypothetical protein